MKDESTVFGLPLPLRERGRGVRGRDIPFSKLGPDMVDSKGAVLG